MARTRSGVSQFYVLLGAIALIGAGTLVWMVMKPKTVSIPIGAPVEVSDTSGFRGYILGSATAPVEVTEYADYQCPACAGFEQIQFPTIYKQLIASGMVRWRYRDFPLDNIHSNARLAAHAAACANEQGKYWELHRLVYDRHAEWAETNRDMSSKFHQFAVDAGLNGSAYDDCMKSAKFAGRIEASLQEGQKLGVPSTPSFVIGSKLYPGAQSSDSIRAWVQSLIPATNSSAPPAKP